MNSVSFVPAHEEQVGRCVLFHSRRYLVLQLLEYEDFGWSFGEAADRHLLELIILEESLSGNELPPATLLHFFDYLIIPIEAHVAEAGGKHGVPALLYREEHFFEQLVVHVIVIYQSGTCHKIKLVLELAWEFLGLAERVLVQLRVHALVRRLFQHVRAHVQAHGVSES